MKHNNTIQKMAAMLTVASLAVAVLPGTSDTSVVASASAYNTWTGYMLQNEKGDYLSVAYGTAVEGQSTDFYIANGNAPYNTWYFTETSYGITIKSALSQGEYYLTGNGDGRLTISTTPGIFTFSEDGLLSDRDGISYGMVTLEAVTNLRSGDLNQNDVVDGYDLTILRQLVLYGNANFIQAAMGDVNGDGVITGQDVALLQQYLLGEDVPLVVVTLPDCTIIPSPEEPPATTTEPTEVTTTELTTTTTEATTTEVTTTTTEPITTTTTPPELTLEDMPAQYVEPMAWIWEERINDPEEGWVSYWDTIYDQIVAEDGHLYYVVKWQSYNELSLPQREQIETLLDTTINAWTDWLVGYDGWEYDHVDVEIVGWAVLNENLLLDRQPGEIVYTDTTEYTDRDYIIECGMAVDADAIPTIAPIAPSTLYRYDNYWNPDHVYGENHFDMYLHAVQGMTDMGGFGWGWGQEMSDAAILGMANGSYSLHILEHEMGHGFGLPDFYGGEGESEGYPPGGFPGDGTSIMMAGSSMSITDFDGWMLRYVWSMIRQEEGRFS